MVRGARIEVGKKELFLILADFPSLSTVECFYFIRQLVALEKKVAANECQPVVVWPRHDGTITAQETCEWKQEIDSRKITLAQLTNLPFSPPA